MESQLYEIAEKIRLHERINREEAIYLYQNAPLTLIGELAHIVRSKQNDPKVVTYLIDRNINYTNVCNSDCSFCGFYRHDPKHPESYVLSKNIIGKKIEQALSIGASRILLQGGHNDELPYEFYPDLIQWIKTNYTIDLNAFSPSEIYQMHLISGKSYFDILSELQDAGLDGLPGGGAEILDDQVRKRVSPKKIRSNVWLDVMKEAHKLNLITTATMVIGFGETIENRLNHFDALRELQDQSLINNLSGFNAFISWPLQANENTSMGRSRHANTFGASPSEYLRNTALARIYLDNIQHHQASWPTLGADVGSIALHYGCDDFGSTMMEENVVSTAGAPTETLCSMSPRNMEEHIVAAGFQAQVRDCMFGEPLETKSKHITQPSMPPTQTL